MRITQGIEQVGRLRPEETAGSTWCISHHIYYHLKSLRVFRALGVRACPSGCYGALALGQATSVTVLVSSVLGPTTGRLPRCMPTCIVLAHRAGETEAGYGT